LSLSLTAGAAVAVVTVIGLSCRDANGEKNDVLVVGVFGIDYINSDGEWQAW